MYLSRVEINPRLRATMLALNSPQRLHAIVAASFPSSYVLGSVVEVPEQQPAQQPFAQQLTRPSKEQETQQRQPVQRHLWRLDRLGHSLYVLVVSPVRPDFTHLIEQLGWVSSQQTWETKPYEPFLERLRPGQRWQFRLRANPTRSVKRPDAPRKRGIVQACVTIDEQKQWLAERVHKHGFSLQGFELVDRSVGSFKRQEEKITVHVATFEGLLKVEDPALLRKALTEGIGRAKAYGCGLLTLARPHVGA
ncbi:MAG: type I-E CRISPR-associated protein Cas6/Cse3/CasE [Coriobacteriales bacterium]|jgi:CRISPR system Cascade subunit CasE|nr:type I-E CRISPR-associated protein Cas6/Cse3/CasE [Coriobacteriales bacterium]